MRLTRFVIRGIFVCSAALATAAPPPSSSILIDRYCAACHNNQLKSGGLSFAGVDLAHPEQNAPQFERVIHKIRAGLMPPPGAPRPDASALTEFAASIEDAIDRAAALQLHPGRPALHRLNRAEYANSVRDLLHLDIDPATLLPPDDSLRGFDNMAGSLTTSPALMDAYIRAASRIARLAIGDPAAAPTTTTWRIPRVVSQLRHVEGTPAGTRGGMAVTHNFPASGDYTFRMLFYSSLEGPLFGRSQGPGQRIDISLDGRRAALLEINPMMLSTDDLRTPPIHVDAGPHRLSAAFVQEFDGPVEDDIQPVGQTLADLNTAVFPGLTTLPHLSELSAIGPAAPESAPVNTPSRRIIFSCHPASTTAQAAELPCARTLRTRLGRQAWRRPVAAAEVEPILRFFQSGRADAVNKQASFDAGIANALEAILASPEFVFRFERVPAGRRTRRGVPGQRYRTGLAPFFFPLEQAAGRPASRARRCPASSRTCGTRSPGPPYAGRFARLRPFHTFRRPMAAPAQPPRCPAGPFPLSRFHPQPREFHAPRDGASLRFAPS